MSDETNPAPHERGAIETAGPLAEGLFARINGIDQWLTIRGADARNPALLILSGPGAAFSAWPRFFAPWEARFTLVQWDQPGAGATHERNGEAGGDLTFDRLVRDGVAVIEHVRARLGKRTLALVCFSAGTIVGLTIAKRRPDLIGAYVGSGQVVDWARQDALSYDLLLAQTRERGDAEAYARLTDIGPPPYADTATDAVKSQYAGAMTAAEGAALAAMDPTVLAELQSVPMTELRARAMRAYDALRPEIVAFDARRLGREFAVPMFFLQGDLDVFTVTSEVRAYAEWLEAPLKRFVPLTGVGHSTFLMREELLRSLEAYVRPVLVAADE